MNISTELFEIALGSERPIKALFDRAEAYLDEQDENVLQDLDTLISGIFIDSLRKGTGDEIITFMIDMLAFIDSSKGDKLKNTKECKKIYIRWTHFIDLCSMADETYDRDTAERLINSMEHGMELMSLLYQFYDGCVIDFLELYIDKDILYTTINEFTRNNLVVIMKYADYTVIKLDVLGRMFMIGTDLPDDQSLKRK